MSQKKTNEKIDFGKRAHLIANHTLSGKGQVAALKSGLIARDFVYNELLLAGDFLGTAVTGRSVGSQLANV